MSVVDAVEVDGHKFYVGSGLETRQDILVPVSSIEGMTDVEIGAAIRSLVPLTRKMDALLFCDWVKHSGVLEEDGTVRQGSVRGILDEAEPHLDQLQEFEDDELIGEVLKIIHSCQQYIQARERVMTVKRQKRTQINSAYESLFVRIGRRDGFRCANCGGSGSDLQIDHIRPLSKDGDNDIANLQLLRRICNMRKRDS